MPETRNPAPGATGHQIVGLVPPDKRERRPGQEAAHLENQISSNTPEYRPERAGAQADLDLEYRTFLGQTTFPDLAPLRERGVGGPGLAVGPVVASLTVERGLWRPDPDGGRAFILPVRVENPLSPESPDPVQAVRAGEIVDLLAFSPAFPARWALRTGVATWLGCIEPQFLMPDPVPVWRSPLHWLGSACRGLVLLTHDRRERYRVLTTCDAIVAEDEQHAGELRDLLRHPWLAPPVLVRRGREVRHAA